MPDIGSASYSIISLRPLLCPVPSQTMFKYYREELCVRTLYGLHLLPGFERHEAGGKRITEIVVPAPSIDVPARPPPMLRGSVFKR
jgi:hypothetical protein